MLRQVTAAAVTEPCDDLAGLRGARLVVTKELSLTGSTFTQPIRLSGAEITGQLTCRGAQLQGSNADGALVADGLKVGGDVFLDQEFTAAGANCETSAIDALCRPVHDPVHPPLG